MVHGFAHLHTKKFGIHISFCFLLSNLVIANSKTSFPVNTSKLYSNFHCSLVGQDSWLSLKRPGFKFWQQIFLDFRFFLILTIIMYCAS